MLVARENGIPPHHNFFILPSVKGTKWGQARWAWKILRQNPDNTADATLNSYAMQSSIKCKGPEGELVSLVCREIPVSKDEPSLVNLLCRNPLVPSAKLKRDGESSPQAWAALPVHLPSNILEESTGSRWASHLTGISKKLGCSAGCSCCSGLWASPSAVRKLARACGSTAPWLGQCFLQSRLSNWCCSSNKTAI